MVDARVIALVLGVVGLAFGVAALAAGVPALGAVAGLAAIAAGGTALAASPQRATAAEPAAPDDRDQTIDRTRRELADARGEVEALRQELAAARSGAEDAPEPPPELAGSDTSALTDPESQLFSEAYFRVALQSRLASARRHLRPVSVCLMQVAQGQVEDASSSAPPARVADAIRETLREADIACRLDDGTFAAILEDTPENGAVWTVERTRRNLVSRSGPHTMWAGVACYPAHAFSGDELLEQARAALVAAQEWNQDRIEVAAVEG
ncbi:GGDEF domain-containing protein [Dermatobacter hominis]|uniref:GGDEF domain-containing protein n=1 Tax=Dermatobacter hominis TaxID=2884263 RepID=UPI001D1034B9|nr:diguanylate cyclase [Dermatobacter hominis]UDY34136.1 GGDEF domain-containing protein [Dermatobacter hominis]